MSAQDTTPVGPLSWLRVVDLTDLRGALCARILADFGADVIRVEPKEPPDSLAHAYRNANKRGVVLDPGDQAALDELLADADVLVENVGVDAITERHPHLVHVALTDLGLSGPRSGWHLEPLPALAASGALWASGFPQFPPCNAPGDLAHDCASVYGAIGAVAAALDRARSGDGRGQVVEVSAQEAGLAGLIPWSVAMQDYLADQPAAPGRREAQRRWCVLGAARSRRVGAHRRRLTEAVGRLQVAHARRGGVRGRRVEEPPVPTDERRRDPHGGAGTPDRPDPRRAVRGGARQRRHGGRASPAERVRRPPADPPPWVLPRRRRRRRGPPVRHPTGETGADAVVDPPRRVDGERARRSSTDGDARAARSAVAATCCSTACG